MQELHIPGWFYYIPDGPPPQYDDDKVGKWMYFYRDPQGFEFARKMCKLAVESGVLKEAKVSESPFQGVSCFYTEADDFDTHRRIINFFIEHNMIRKTKDGKLYNISFKYDRQTDAGEYGSDFKAELKLSEFINLQTGKWLK